jgi:hypothetical protein
MIKEFAGGYGADDAADADRKSSSKGNEGQHPLRLCDDVRAHHARSHADTVIVAPLQLHVGSYVRCR